MLSKISLHCLLPICSAELGHCSPNCKSLCTYFPLEDFSSYSLVLNRKKTFLVFLAWNYVLYMPTFERELGVDQEPGKEERESKVT